MYPIFYILFMCSTYNIITLRPLGSVAVLVRATENPQLLTLQYTDGESRAYLSTDRDSLLARYRSSAVFSLL